VSAGRVQAGGLWDQRSPWLERTRVRPRIRRLKQKLSRQPDGAPHAKLWRRPWPWRAGP